MAELQEETPNPRQVEIPSDVLSLIFEQLVGDSTTLSSASLTSRAWHSHAIPFLLRDVDLSSHNLGRWPEAEDEVYRPVVYTNYDGYYRPASLLSRQRAFLRLITEYQELARYTQSLTWTLIWLDSNNGMSEAEEITDMDLETWNVFSFFVNVTYLDLASLHGAWYEPITRLQPARLFPAVTDLRLLGWMHRGLVAALVSSTSTERLRRLRIDYLEDEGAFLSGIPMPTCIARDFAHSARRSPNGNPLAGLIGNELCQRQDAGTACIFPGPMWWLLRELSTRPLDTLEDLQIRLAPFSHDIDERNYHTFFHEVRQVITQARQSLKSLTITLGEWPGMFEEPSTGCATGRAFVKYRVKPFCVRLAASFLTQLLDTLQDADFSLHVRISIKGFHLLETTNPMLTQAYNLSGILRRVQESPFSPDIDTSYPNLDYRPGFHGHDYAQSVQDLSAAEQEALRRS